MHDLWATYVQPAYHLRATNVPPMCHLYTTYASPMSQVCTPYVPPWCPHCVNFCTTHEPTMCLLAAELVRHVRPQYVTMGHAQTAAGQLCSTGPVAWPDCAPPWHQVCTISTQPVHGLVQQCARWVPAAGYPGGRAARSYALWG